MLTEAEILVHLDYRLPGHACTDYTGIYRGQNRNGRRRAYWELEQKWKSYERDEEYHQQVWRLVYYPFPRNVMNAQLKEHFADRIFVDPMGYLAMARLKANHEFLYKRGYLPLWYVEIVKYQRGPCWALPWPPRGLRKLSRWQLPPMGKKSRRCGGLSDSIALVDLFPEEWRPKDADDVEDEELVTV